MRILWALTLAAGVHAAPAVNATVNAASNLPSAAPNGVIARGAMFVVYGTGMGPNLLARADSLPLRTTLAGTSARVTVAGTTVDCLMIYTSAGQISAILPSRTPAGDGTLTVSYNGEASPASAVRVANAGFGIFTRNQGGSGPAIVQNANADGSLIVNSLLAPARPGQVAVLWGTGLGAVQGDEAGGPLPGNIAGDITLFVGGQPADLDYRGRSGCCPGVDQLSFRVPDIPGCYVPIAVRASGVTSNIATMTIDGGPACSDPTGPASADLESLRDARQLTYGLVDLTRTVIEGSPADTLDASFFRTSTEQLEAHNGVRSISVGSCVTTWQQGAASGTDPRIAVGLNAGTEIMVAGNRRLPLVSPGTYSAGDRLALDPGEVSVENGSGGPDISAFRTSVPVAPPLTWNQAAFTDITRGNDLTVTWTGGEPGRDNVVIYGVAPSDRGTGGFYCVASRGAGRFTVPGWITSTLPPSTTGALGAGVTLADGVRFRANGLRFGVAASSTVSVKRVTYR